MRHDLSGKSPSPGQVWLVGAGPGDPELLTLKAARLIREADVILYDALVSPEILALARPQALLEFVGKRAGHHCASQPELNQLMADHALLGRMVVRLKGGDPGIFGRAAEEIDHLTALGITVQMVPGITAALGCAAALTLPLTERGVAHRLILATGHHVTADGVQAETINGHQDTLVYYMGARQMAAIVPRLLAEGWQPDTPAAVIAGGTTPRQQVTLTRLDTLVADLSAVSTKQPILIVLGAVARRAANHGTGQITPAVFASIMPSAA